MNLNFSVIIPTLNEADNIDALLSRLFVSHLFALNLPQDSFEVIVVDDGSSDDTPARIRAWAERAPVRLIERREKPDLTAAILAGVSVAHSQLPAPWPSMIAMQEPWTFAHGIRLEEPP